MADVALASRGRGVREMLSQFRPAAGMDAKSAPLEVLYTYRNSAQSTYRMNDPHSYLPVISSTVNE